MDYLLEWAKLELVKYQSGRSTCPNPEKATLPFLSLI